MLKRTNKQYVSVGGLSRLRICLLENGRGAAPAVERKNGSSCGELRLCVNYTANGAMFGSFRAPFHPLSPEVVAFDF
jgi:hypothetical protein